jgi:hypothetical protein
MIEARTAIATTTGVVGSFVLITMMAAVTPVAGSGRLWNDA